MIMFSKFPNFPDELSENDELSEYELSGSDCIVLILFHLVLQCRHNVWSNFWRFCEKLYTKSQTQNTIFIEFWNTVDIVWRDAISATKLCSYERDILFTRTVNLSNTHISNTHDFTNTLLWFLIEFVTKK